MLKLILPRFVRAMAYVWALLLATLALCAPASARVQHHAKPVASQQAAQSPMARPALWKVQKGETVIYLFGTVHALPAHVEWFNGALAQAFDGSSSLVTEIIEKTPEEMRGIVMSKAVLPDGESLRESLSPATRKAMEKALVANGMNPALFDRFRPWYAAVALSTLPLMKSGYDPANGVDTRLVKLAQERGMEHSALETPEYQLGLFDSLPLASQRSYLREVAVNAPKITSELGAMIAAWKAGDAPRLARLINADQSDPKLAEALLIGRNRHWADWIAQRLSQPGKVFIAVGAGHLAGHGSVQEQLAKRGIVAKRVQ